MNSIRIFGAGMAGLLAANMLRRLEPVVLEKAPSLPNNHAALLRFRSDAVSKATGIPFRKVTVTKAINFNGQCLFQPFLPMCNMYSMKVSGEVHERSILNLEPAERFIAPPDFISQLSKGCNIAYDCPLDSTVVAEQTVLTKGDAAHNLDNPIISTVPMPALMDLVKWDDKPVFNSRKIVTGTATIADAVDVYQTLYYPSPDVPWYRASITGNKFIVEMMANSITEGFEDGFTRMLESIIIDFGILDPHLTDVKFTTQTFGKIAPIPTGQRKQFILAMSDLHNIYSLGRFATWRQMLLDDVVNDVQIIERFILERDSYGKRLSHV